MELHCSIGVPLLVGDDLRGTLATFAARAGDAGDDEVAYLSALAEQAALAIQNARLYGEVRDRLAEVTGLQAANAALVEELQPERALRTVAEQAKALSAAATVSIELLRPGGPSSRYRSPLANAVDLAGVRVSVEASVSARPSHWSCLCGLGVARSGRCRRSPTTRMRFIHARSSC